MLSGCISRCLHNHGVYRQFTLYRFRYTYCKTPIHMSCIAGGYFRLVTCSVPLGHHVRNQRHAGVHGKLAGR